MSIQVLQPSIDTCHSTVGVGVPLAAAENVTLSPSFTVWLTGSVVTTGATSGITVSTAGLVVASGAGPVGEHRLVLVSVLGERRRRNAQRVAGRTR